MKRRDHSSLNDVIKRDREKSCHAVIRIKVGRVELNKGKILGMGDDKSNTKKRREYLYWGNVKEILMGRREGGFSHVLLILGLIAFFLLRQQGRRRIDKNIKYENNKSKESTF